MNVKPLPSRARPLLSMFLSAGLLAACSGDAGTGPAAGTGGAPAPTASGGSPGTGGAVSVSTGGAPMGTGGAMVAPEGTGGATPTPGTGGRGMGGARGMGAPGTGGMIGPPPPPLGPCTAVPVNPKATQQAKNLLCFLYSQYGNHVLSGQQETSWSNPAKDITFYTGSIGKAPAILGGDYLYPSGTSTRAIAYWQAGGIPMIRYHMGAPPTADSYQNAMGSANIANVLMAGTAENTSFNSKLDYAAAEIQKLQDANVALIWAPFHEVQPNGWFWWAKGTGPQFVSLWKYMFNYFTTTKGLNNIVWLLPYSGSPNAGFFPGKEFVDIGGPDTYGTNQPFVSQYNSAHPIFGQTTPMTLHETGTIPQPANMFPAAAPWVLFNVWAGFETSANTSTTIASTYNSPFTVTRDEIPSLK